MTDLTTAASEFRYFGRAWLRGAVNADAIQALRKLATLDGRAGARISHDRPLFHAIAAADFNAKIQLLWPDMIPVRLLSFDKSGKANWGVPWHQDRVIAVQDQHVVDGYSNWSQKAGAWHCEPPTEVLEKMLFVRVHLDANTAENGAMEVALGSHRAGKVQAKDAATIAGSYETELTTAEAGDVLVLSMLTLHRSSRARITTGRHTLRLDYAPSDLPHPLRWAV